jgi:acetylornithine/succinyldiaminopimelate/putrescine aminotransferase/predicted amino acid dehydrogenase
MNRAEAGEQYTQFLKPLAGKLLSFLKLDKTYIDGRGNWLLHQDARGNPHWVLDSTGGYGANLLGHKNPEILEAIPKLLAELPPNHLQGSIAGRSAMLAQELSDRLSAETHEGPWVCTLANSGAEAVEAALKHALLYHKEWTKKKVFTLNAYFNSLRKQLETLAADKKESLLAQIKENVKEASLPEALSDGLSQSKDIDEAVDCLDHHNKKILLAPPYFLALEGGFHGKTLGALRVTENPTFRDDFFLDDENIKTLFIKRNNQEDIPRALTEVRASICLPHVKHGKTSLSLKEMNKIAACILEPIQGEGGVHPLEKGFVKALREEADRRGFLLIFDEIQAGLYRTGTLSSGTYLGVHADLYCFSKALGGGVAKISAMLTKQEKYVLRFSYLHTSTFAEDSFSSAIATKVLGMLTPSSVQQGMSVAEALKKRLHTLQDKYPALIKEIRGRGFLLGIEFQSTLRHSCYELKLFCDLGMLGYFLSSALLNNEHLRLSPTLSSPFTLRLEPSLFTTEDEVRHICSGLEGLCRALSALDMTYFFGHLFPGYKIGSAHRIPEGVIKYAKGTRPSAVFLSHVIRTEDTKKIFHALENVPVEIIEQNLKDIFELVEFEVYFHGPLKGTNGQEVDAVILALPIPSSVIHELYKSERFHLLNEKIQNGLQYARELGATTVGLGQFTSIVTKNGLSLEPQGMNLTTGNAYTVALVIEAGLKLAEEKKINMNRAHIGFVGIAGNIVSVSAAILADHCGRISLFYHTPVEQSKKLVRTLESFFQDMVLSRSEGCCTRKLKALLLDKPPKGKENLVAFLGRPEVKEVLGVETDLSRLRQCDIVLTGTNASRVLIEPSFLKENAVIIDVGVPGDVPADLREIRPDVTVIKGGIARMPQPDKRPQSIILPSFPLKEGQAFGCMSETFSIGLFKGDKIYHVGPLSKEVVEKAHGIAEGVGFQLSHYKDVDTFDF